jgi:hypothetical protein
MLAYREVDISACVVPMPRLLCAKESTVALMYEVPFVVTNNN